MESHFKFIADPNAVQYLLKGVVKFTSIPELNDPSELTANVIFEEVRESLERLRKDGYTENDMLNLQRQGNLFQRLAPQCQVIDVPETKEAATTIIRSPFYSQISELERRLSETTQIISDKVGLLCLSSRYDSLPMWAHYTSNATGLVVEFTDLKKTFQGDNTGVLYQPIAVRYEREHSGVTFETWSHESLFFSKFQDWSYEQEVRVVVPLNECRQQVVGGKRLYLYEIPKTCIIRIILGWNMSKDARKAVHKFVRDINDYVQVVEAQIIGGRVEIREAS